MAEARILLTTFASQDEARQLGTQLIEKGLAACMTILPPSESIYRWEGKVCHENEVPILLKTSASRLAELKEALLEQHPYDTPECLILSPSDGSDAYLDWLNQMTSPPSSSSTQR